MSGNILWLAMLVLAGVAGACLFTVGACLLVALVRSGRLSTVCAVGTVVENVVEEGDEGFYHYPIIEFHSAGTAHRFKGLFGRCGRPDYRIGHELRIYYPPGRPDLAQVGRHEGLVFVLTPTVVGLALLLGMTREIVRLFE
jgi:hypothetical protein